MKKKFYYLFFSLFLIKGISQEISQDTIIKEKKLNFKFDFQSRYIWRGQSWGGNYFVFQPSVEYQLTNKITLGFWATTNFKKDYFYTNGIYYKGYQEIDFYIIYRINDFLALQLWDYYWPSVAKVAGVKNVFFNYGREGVKTVDFNLLFDFSDRGFPLNATISTLMAGNDFRYDFNRNNPKQNFTTYAEVGYIFEDVFASKFLEVVKEISISPSIGVVFNNQAKYYTAGDYDRPSLVNISLKVTKELGSYKSVSIPISIVFTHNAATKNTNDFGRNFIIFSTGLNF